jgi:hypothetical protein
MSDTFTAAANSMFPNMAPAAAPTVPPAAQPAETDEQRQARVLFGDSAPKPPAPSKPPAADEDEIDKAERFFENSPIFEDAKREIEQAAIEGLQTPEQAAAIAAEYEPWMKEWALNSTDASQLAQLGVSAVTNPVSDETAAGWVEASRTAIRTDWGPRGGEALAAARQLIAKDPSLVAFLEQTKLGNSPAFVRAACNRAMDLKKRGKL